LGIPSLAQRSYSTPAPAERFLSRPLLASALEDEFIRIEATSFSRIVLD
jgi:hypothetical protein